MPTTKKPPRETLRSWRVSLLRQRAQVLGSVTAQDKKSAQAEAVAQFNLNEEQRLRLAVREEKAANSAPSKNLHPLKVPFGA
jgi:hypothetical protein